MNKKIILIAAIFSVAGCAHKKSDQTAATTMPSTQPQIQADAESTNTSKAKQDKSPKEIIGTPAPDSKFARLKLGMSMREVHALIGTPDDLSRHETGKRWIPFYFGSDAQRLETLYKSEGCLTYTGGNIFGGGGGQLIRIAVDLKTACWHQG